MESRIGRNVNNLKGRAKRGAFGAALSLGLLALYPSVVSAQETPIQPVTSVYPQCGGNDFPSDQTVMVVVLGSGDDKVFKEYPMGKKSGECGNKISQTSSIVLESVSRAALTRPDVISEATRPVVCAPGTVAFRVGRINNVDGIDIDPASGSLDGHSLPLLHANIHTDLLSNGNYFKSARVSCITPEDVTIPGEDIHFAVQIKP